MHCKIMATRIKIVLPTSPLKWSQANSPLGFLNVFHSFCLAAFSLIFSQILVPHPFQRVRYKVLYLTLTKTKGFVF